MTNDTFLKKVAQILDENLEDASFGVSELATEIGISRSQLHRKINAKTDKSPSIFIREFRLQKALELLLKTELTAAEIAYQVGFSSPSYFNTSFRSYFGYPPGEAKVRNEVPKSIRETQNENKRERPKRNLLKWSIWIILLAALLISSLTIFREYGRKTSEKTPIAILPIKNLSSEMQYGHFLEGMREDIINRLSQVDLLSVKSKQSSDFLAQDSLSLKEFGERLQVAYIMEGTFQKQRDSIKIIVHLLETASDSHIWSQEFTGPMDRIFQLEAQISERVAHAMNLNLATREEQLTTKPNTQTIASYNAYLQGKHFLYQYTPEGLRLAHEYFQQSIALDSSSALAYSGMAEFFFYSSFPIFTAESLSLAKLNAKKALELKNPPADAYRIWGTLMSEAFWKWEEAENAFVQALEIDPNDCYSANAYALFLMHVKGDLKTSRALIERAKINCPVFYYHYIASAEHYLQTGEFTKALEEIQLAKNLDPAISLAYRIEFKTYWMMQDGVAALSALEQRYSLNPYQKAFIPEMKHVFETGGIEAVLARINEVNIQNVDAADLRGIEYNTARNYALLQEADKALEWLERAYANKNRFLFQIKYDFHFTSLRQDPRFLTVLEKMNLGTYTP